MLEVEWIPPEIANEGLHNIEIISIEDLGVCDGKFRAEPKCKVVFQMLDQKDAEGLPVEIWEQFPLKISPTSKLRKFLYDLGLGGKRGTQMKFNLADLVGTRFQAIISHREDELTGRTYANIATIIKPRPTKIVCPSEAV